MTVIVMTQSGDEIARETVDIINSGVYTIDANRGLRS
jgi:hypothetical protein